MNIFLIIFLFASLSHQQSGNFPGSTDSLKSPDGNFWIINIDTARDSDFNHTLFLKDSKSGRVEELLEYARSVAVLWSPDSKGFAITDYEGSDYSNCKIFVLGDITRIVSIQTELESHFKTNRHIFENHHVYIEAREWINSTSVKININGYGEIDPDGFDLWFVFDTIKGLTQLR